MNFEPEIESLLQRFENIINQGITQYLDTEELETIIDCYIVLDQYDKARIALDYAYRIHPSSTEIHCKEAKLALMTDNCQLAIEILESTPYSEPDNIAILGESYLRMGDISKSKELFTQYLTLCNTNELDQIFVDIASLYNSNFQPQITLDFIESGIAIFPDNIELITEKAIALEQLNQLDEAAQLFTTAIESKPHQPELWCMLGTIYFRQERFADAIQAYDYALALNPSDTLTTLERAHCFFNLAQYDKAVEPYTEYLAQNPEDAMVTTYLAETYEHLEQWQLAEKLYRRALKIYDGIPETWIGLATCQHNLDRTDAAYRTIKKADKKFPENQNIVYAMSRIEADLFDETYDQKLLIKSLEHLSFCIDNDPENPTLCFEAANIFFKFGNAQSAIQLYELVYEKEPYTERLTLLMAICYYALDNLDKAKHFILISRETISNTNEIFLSFHPVAFDWLKNL